MQIQNRFCNSVQILAGGCGVVFGAGKGINGSQLQLEALQMEKKIEGTLTVTPIDNGNTLTTTGYLTIGGKKSDDLHDVFHRVSK